MLLKILKTFRQETEKKYKEGLTENMAEWKKTVMRMHDEAEFLFYFDEFTDWDERKGSCVIMGSYTRGNPQPGTVIHLYSGQAELLARAKLVREIQEAELKLAGFSRERKYLCELQLLCKETQSEQMLRIFQRLNGQLSLLSDYQV